MLFRSKYIKGMLNEPDLQPNATINRWIQGILLFDFELIHVPATKFKGPDALSRKEQTPEDLANAESDDEWLDRKSTRLNSSHSGESRMPSSA